MCIENKPVYVEIKDHLLNSSMRRLNVTSFPYEQVKRRGKTEYIAVKKSAMTLFLPLSTPLKKS